MPRSDGRSIETRRRLLEAGLAVFAEEGYRRATIQQICRRAGANIAAAHYHFGDKERLYAAVFEHAEQRAREDPLNDPPVDPAARGTPQDRLHAHIVSFLQRLLDPQRPTAWLARLLAHELIDPTPALDRLVRRRMRANHEQIAALIRELAPAAPKETVRFATLSVVAQCVFYRNSAAIVSRLYPEVNPERDLQRIAEHVTRFSLGAIDRLGKPSKMQSKTQRTASA